MLLYIDQSRPSNRVNTTARLAALRSAMKNANVQAYITTNRDEQGVSHVTTCQLSRSLRANRKYSYSKNAVIFDCSWANLLITRSSAVAKRPRDASCLYSFNTKRRVQSVIISCFGFRYTTAYN